MAKKVKKSTFKIHAFVELGEGRISAENAGLFDDLLVVDSVRPFDEEKSKVIFKTTKPMSRKQVDEIAQRFLDAGDVIEIEKIVDTKDSVLKRTRDIIRKGVKESIVGQFRAIPGVSSFLEAKKQRAEEEKFKPRIKDDEPDEKDKDNAGVGSGGVGNLDEIATPLKNGFDTILDAMIDELLPPIVHIDELLTDYFAGLPTSAEEAEERREAKRLSKKEGDDRDDELAAAMGLAGAGDGDSNTLVEALGDAAGSILEGTLVDDAIAARIATRGLGRGAAGAAARGAAARGAGAVAAGAAARGAAGSAAGTAASAAGGAAAGSRARAAGAAVRAGLTSFMTLMGTSVGAASIASVAGTVLAGAGIGYILGTAIFDNVISPAMDKKFERELARMNRSSARSMGIAQTETGEDAFIITDETGKEIIVGRSEVTDEMIESGEARAATFFTDPNTGQRIGGAFGETVQTGDVGPSVAEQVQAEDPAARALSARYITPLRILEGRMAAIADQIVNESDEGKKTQLKETFRDLAKEYYTKVEQLEDDSLIKRDLGPDRFNQELENLKSTMFYKMGDKMTGGFLGLGASLTPRMGFGSFHEALQEIASGNVVGVDDTTTSLGANTGGSLTSTVINANNDVENARGSETTQNNSVGMVNNTQSSVNSVQNTTVSGASTQTQNGSFRASASESMRGQLLA